MSQMKFYKLSSSAMVILASLYACPGAAMEGQRPDDQDKKATPKSALVHNFATLNEEELLASYYPNMLKKKLNDTINKPRFIHGDLTEHYAVGLVDLLNKNASPETIYHHLGICKTVCEPGAAEATVMNSLPKDISCPHMLAETLFESVGVKFNYNWDDAEMILAAHKYGVPLRIDLKIKQRSPLVLTAEELERYQAHHDFRIAIHGFYNDYTKLINAQRARRGEEPIRVFTEEHYSEPEVAAPMTEKEKHEMIYNAKLKLAEAERNRARRQLKNDARHKAEEERREEARKAAHLAQQQKGLEVEKMLLKLEQQKLLEEQAKLQEMQGRLKEQALQNEKKMQAFAAQTQRRVLENEQAERRRQEQAERMKQAQAERRKQEQDEHKKQEQARQLIDDEKMARALERQVQDDEALAWELSRQLNG